MRPIPEPVLPRMVSKAQQFCDTIGEQAKRFTRGCEKDGEEPVIIANDGFQRFHLARIGAVGAETVVLIGETDDGKYIELIANIAAVRITMIAEPKTGAEPKRRSIGFLADHREDDDLTTL